MKRTNSDPLLLAGKVIAIFMQGAMAFGGLVLAGVTIAVLFFNEPIIAEFAADTGNPDIALPIPALIGVFIIGMAILAAMFVFFGKLRQIINTVGEGDPFQPANADRLSLMGWLMLGVHLLFVPAAALGHMLAEFASQLEDASLTVDGGVDLSGLLLVIILFILARVFRHGAAMRDDLEGTV